MKDLIKVFKSGQVENGSLTYQEAIQKKQDIIWKKFAEISVLQSIENWLKSLSLLTRKNYASALKKIVENDLLNPDLNLQQFSLVNHENVVDEIKLIQNWSEATRQARAAAYISYTGYLQRKTQGMISKAMANREGVAKTFFKTREKVKTSPLTPDETNAFLIALEKINYRDALIAKVILQGGKRKSEVLELPIKNVDFKKQTDYI